MCTGRKYHLSTYMTAFDRDRVIKEIRSEISALEREFTDLNNVPEERKITVISTSLIEAGVDMDFYTVFREISGADHILQAGGRCNREGKRESADVYVFEFDDCKKTPQKDIGAEISRRFFYENRDISSEECIKEYYDKLFFIKKDKIVKNAMYQYTQDIRSLPFSQYSANFSIIESETVSVVAVCDKTSLELVDEIKQTEYGDIRKLQKYTFSIYPYELEILIQQNAVKDYGSGIWCLTNMDYYDTDTGVIFEAQDYFI